jgi:hypothetical protein
LVSPASGPTSGFTSVLIAGKNFTGAKEVTFGSHQASFVVLRPTLILAVTPKVSSPGTVSVTVLTSSGSSAASGGATFTYVRPRPFRGPSGYHEGRH